MWRHRQGQIPLWMAVCLAIALAIALSIWTVAQKSERTDDGRKAIVFWGSTTQLGEEIQTVIHRFEQKNPEYRVIMSSAAARDTTGDAQRLMCAVAGEVPPDVVYFDRFAIGEWAARGALTDLRPLLEKQDSRDPYRLNLDDYYEYTIAEGSYRPPGTNETPGLYGVPCSTDIRFLFCNGDVLRQCGLVDEKGNPKAPRNWDELREYANKITLYRTPGDKRSGITRLGFAPNTGNSWLYLYAWQAGGEMMNADRTKVTMTSAPVVRALRFMTDVYDDLGGVAQVKSFEEAQQGGSLDPFLLGRLAMMIDGNWRVANVADWKPDMDFVVAPAPMPQDQIDAGQKPVAWSGGYSLVIPATARQKEGAFKFIQFLRSWESIQMLEQGSREQREAEGKIYLPRIDVNRVYCKRLFDTTVLNNPRMPETFKRTYRLILELLPHTLIRPVTPVGQLLWTKHVNAFDAAVRHGYAEEARNSGRDEVELALERSQAIVQAELDSITQPPPPHVVNWTPYLWLYALLVVVPFVAMWRTYHKRRREYGYRAREVGAAMLFASPWMLGFAVLVGGPILFSIVLSFSRYDVLNPARYVGASNFTSVITDPTFYKSLYNTLYMAAAIPLGMIISLAIALLLNRAVRGIGFYRAGYYMPAIVPLVAASLMWIWILNPNYGLINGALGWMYDTWLFHGVERLISNLTAQPFKFSLPLWLQHESSSKPSLILMKLWGAGGGMIIWLAGLQSIPNELYEAARVDGAGPWHRFRHVTIPMLSPYILFNLIIGLIGTMQIFSEAYIMTPNGEPVGSTLFYAYYLFQQAFQFFRMGYASSLAWILFIVVLLLTLLQLWLSKKWVHYEQA